MAKIFISYARSDKDEKFIGRLYNDLSKAGNDVWWDRKSMSKRTTPFPKEIQKAISEYDRLLLIFGPKASNSEWVQSEINYAQKKLCKVVITIFRKGNKNLSEVPENWKKADVLFFDESRPYDDALSELLRVLEDEIRLGKLIRVPKIPVPFSPRPEDAELLARNLFLSPEQPSDLSAAEKTVFIWGMGGMGKSVLASSFVRECDTRFYFGDGIHWVKFNETRDPDQQITKGMQLVGKGLGDDPALYKNADDSKTALTVCLEEKDCLIVLDNIWHGEIIDAFSSGLGPSCQLLVTTRLRELAEGSNSEVLKLEVLTDKAALQFLADWTGPKKYSPLEAENVCKECGNHPYALALCGAMVKNGTPWSDILQARRDADLEYLSGKLPEYREHKNVYISLRINLDALKKEDGGMECWQRYMDFAVFHECDFVPESVVMTLWSHLSKLQEYKLRDILIRLESRALLRLEGEYPLREVSLHDLQKDLLFADAENIRHLHDVIGKILFDWWRDNRLKDKEGPDLQKEDYIMKHLLSHLVNTKRWDEVKDLLTDIEYLKRRQSPSEQFNFQKELITLLKNEKVTTDKLINILMGVLKVIQNEMSNKLPEGKLKADWLDTFAYWINEFGVTDESKKSKRLRQAAIAFDTANGDITEELTKDFLSKGDNDWALRFAELRTWVYQRAGNFQKCVDACEDAEKMCEHKKMDEAYRLLGRAEFMRMRAHALRILSERETDGTKKANYETSANEAYDELNKIFSKAEVKSWKSTVQDWQTLEKAIEDDSSQLLDIYSKFRKDRSGKFKAKVVSNAHDCISAIYIILFFEKLGGSVKWIHHKKFRPKDFTSEDTLFTVLLGGPKSPGISDVSDKFYKTDKENFLKMYSGLYCEAFKLKTEVGITYGYMLGGISKMNTLKAAYEYTRDKDVMKIIKKLK